MRPLFPQREVRRSLRARYRREALIRGEAGCKFSSHPPKLFQIFKLSADRLRDEQDRAEKDSLAGRFRTINLLGC